MTPSVVENALFDPATLGKILGTTAYDDSINDITVIINTDTGRVITVDYGRIRQ